MDSVPHVGLMPWSAQRSATIPSQGRIAL